MRGFSDGSSHCPVWSRHSVQPPAFLFHSGQRGWKNEAGIEPSLGLAAKLLTWTMFSHKMFTGQPTGGVPVVGNYHTSTHSIWRPKAPSLPASHSYFFRGVAGSQVYLEHISFQMTHNNFHRQKCPNFFQNGASGCPENGSSSTLRWAVGKWTQISPAGWLEFYWSVSSRRCSPDEVPESNKSKLMAVPQGFLKDLAC